MYNILHKKEKIFFKKSKTMESINDKNQICLICFCELEKNDSIDLECEHDFHKKCLFEYWKGQISSGTFNISLLKCPQDKCFKPINLQYLKQYITPEDYSRLEEQCNLNSEVLNKDEKAIFCRNCNLRFNIWIGADYFECPKCKITYCSQCLAENSKHKGLTCKQFAEIKDLTEEDRIFIKFMKENGYKKCPSCYAYVEKIGGCNFIRCTSNQCNKKKCFCCLCDKIIDEKEHYSHYQFSPWEGPCINQLLDNPENNQQKNDTDGDNSSNDEDKKDIKNWVECPKCKVFDGKICRVENNYSQDIKFCYCTSAECDGTTYCLLCKKKVANENFDSHYQGNCRNSCSIF